MSSASRVSIVSRVPPSDQSGRSASPPPLFQTPIVRKTLANGEGPTRWSHYRHPRGPRVSDVSTVSRLRGLSTLSFVWTTCGGVRVGDCARNVLQQIPSYNCCVSIHVMLRPSARNQRYKSSAVLRESKGGSWFGATDMLRTGSWRHGRKPRAHAVFATQREVLRRGFACCAPQTHG